MWFRVLWGVLLVAGAAGAAQMPLEGGRHAQIQRGKVFAVFRQESALRELPDPRCPAATSVRAASATEDTGEIALDCGGWRANGAGFQYRGDAVRVTLYPGRLGLKVLGGAHAGPFLEMRLRVDDASFCGRFEMKPEPRRRGVSAGPSSPCRRIHPRPNLFVIQLDDARPENLDLMPVAQDRLVRAGVSFAHAATPNAACCPSRASFLTGLYSVNHRVRTNTPPIGGWPTFQQRGHEERSLNVWLQGAGYRTGLFGKYMNWFYGEIPPGWDRFWGGAGGASGGVHGNSYSVFEEDGSKTIFQEHRDDSQYITDAGAAQVLRFIEDAVADGQPFFAYWNPVAPHVEVPGFLPAPAARHFGSLVDLAPWRPASWFESDVTDKPRWVANQSVLESFTDLQRQRGQEALLAVDEQIGVILDRIKALGQERDTVVILTSDNGAGWGEHRSFAMFKGCPYAECLRVPLVVRYPRKAAEPRVVDETVALNIDLAPTLADLAGAEVPLPIDGRSLRGWFDPEVEPAVRRDHLIEHWRKSRTDTLRLTGAPVDGDRLRLFHGNPEIRPRHSTVFEFDVGDGTTAGAWALPLDVAPLEILELAVWLLVPDARVRRVGDALETRPRAHRRDDVYWWVESDAGGVFVATYPLPDHFGVWDAIDGAVWVDYATGEKELYDLVADPDQLENVADDPAYAALRARMEARLAELLAEAAQNGRMASEIAASGGMRPMAKPSTGRSSSAP